MILLLAGGTAWFWSAKRRHPVQTPLAVATVLAEAASHSERPVESGLLIEAMRADIAAHRRLIVLFADEASLRGPEREAALSKGHELHHERIALAHQVDGALLTLAAQDTPRRDPVVSAFLDWMERSPEILELDRLAFRDPLRMLEHALLKDRSSAGAALEARIHEDLAEVDRVEALVEAEYRQVFGGRGVRAQGGERQRWNAYVNQLRTLFPEMEAKPPMAPVAKLEGAQEINGRELPDKVLVLTFDDGPHHVYTEEIKTILQRYQVPGLFFEVGRNLGSLDATGTPKLGTLADLTEDLVKAGYVVGNHSYTHTQLSKETGRPLDIEIGETDRLLQAIPGAHSQLFRFPYGARTAVQLQALQPYRLRSVLWNIDSMDWADPVPSSVEDRVLRTIAEEKRGIILFHDIHDRAGKVLPSLIEHLRAEGYQFAGLDGTGKLVTP